LEASFAVLGRIYASFSPLRVVSGILVKEGRVAFAGSSEEAVRLARELGGEVLDFRKYAVVPGFIDSHMHLDGLGMSLMTLDLRGAKSIEEVKRRLRQFRDEGRGEKVIIGRGWDQELFEEKRWPSASDIDEAAGGIPTVLVRVCGHAAVLSSSALEMLLREGVDPLLLQRDEAGKPTGVVFEEAVGKALSLLSGELNRRDLLKRASLEAARHGVTAVGFMSAKLSDLKILGELREYEELKTRVFAYLEHGELKSFDDSGSRRFGEMVAVKGIKLFADGSFGARTALLSEPYADAPETRGVSVMSAEELSHWMRAAAERNLQVAVHAIGDAALDAVLEAFSFSGVRGIMGRVEHASLARPDQIERMASLGVGAAVQPHFIVSDWWLVRRLGMERARYAYPFKSMLRAGIRLGFSTDSPVEPIDPWLTVEAAVRRGEREGVELHEITKHEKLSIEEALHCYTKGSAAIMGERSLGSLEEGSEADFLVLSRDPLAEEDLSSVEVLETYVGGRRVFSKIGEKG